MQESKLTYVLREILTQPTISQRELAKICSLSLGSVNALLKYALAEKLLYKADNTLLVSDAGLAILQRHKVEQAIILAAGFGSRFVPLSFDTPKGLLKVYNERMVERQIKHLHEVGIYDITIVVGYLKEKFEYLIDKYGVKLLYNPEYSTKNTIATIYHARHLLYNKNTYILSSDNWIRRNMYHAYEPHAWYSSVFMTGETGEYVLHTKANGSIRSVEVGGHDAYVMYGSVYFDRSFADAFLPILEEYYHKPGSANMYWEDVLKEILDKKLPFNSSIYINVQESDNVYEFENLEELRAFDEYYNHTSDNEAMHLISQVFDVSEDKIHGLRCLKSGMTNKSFIFYIGSNAYICRIPGKGTERLIDRQSEYKTYQLIGNLDISEEIIYFDKASGYKIARFYEHSRNGDFHNIEDIKSCIPIIRRLHHADIQADYRFDIFAKIAFYENLCLESGGIPFDDYDMVKKNIMSLQTFLEPFHRKECFCHIDSVQDNFIFTDDGIRLIDWEYASMADPILDLAMLSIYSYYDRNMADTVLDLYFDGQTDESDRQIFYAYIAISGFLWTLWAIYKSNLGESFGDYTLKMYRYAKDFFRLLS